MNKKSLLSNMCKSLLDKNYELYLKHETMLEQEQEERKKLASTFQDQMKDVTLELENQKSTRNEEIEVNTSIRGKI
jgi:HKD family nuclease